MVPLTIFTLIGLAFNIAGTFLMAFSIKYPHKIRISVKEIKEYFEGDLVKFEKNLFRCGLCILGLGFFLQFTAIILELILS